MLYENIKIPEDPKFAQKVEKLQTWIDDLKARISQARKEGKDVFVADILMRNIKPKVQYAEVTRETVDIRKVELQLEEAEKELKEAINDKTEDFKTEVKKKLIKEGLREEEDKEE